MRELILDVPLNGNLKDYSGYGFDLQQINGNAQFENADDNVLGLKKDNDNPIIKTLGFSVNEIINNCRIEIDFCFYSFTSPAYPNIIDSSNSGSSGILAQRNGNILQVGFLNSHQGIINIPLTLLNEYRWYKLILEKISNYERFEIIDVEYNLTTFLNEIDDSLDNKTSTQDFIYLGASCGFGGRQLNGLLKNLRIYQYHHEYRKQIEMININYPEDLNVPPKVYPPWKKKNPGDEETK